MSTTAVVVYTPVQHFFMTSPDAFPVMATLVATAAAFVAVYLVADNIKVKHKAVDWVATGVALVTCISLFKYFGILV